MDSDTGLGLGVVSILLLVFALSIAGLVFWILTLVEVVRIPEHQFRAAAVDKTVWVLVVGLAGWIGALIWRFTVRSAVLAAEGQVPAPPPGWYPEPGTGAWRWWDGRNWSGPPHPPPP
jgi:hypothetical protein